MLFTNNIFAENDYLVHRGISRHLPLSYLIKTMGLDCVDGKDKKNKGKRCPEYHLRGPNDKFAAFLLMFLFRKPRRAKRKKVKEESYEKVEETV